MNSRHPSVEWYRAVDLLGVCIDPSFDVDTIGDITVLEQKLSSLSTVATSSAHDEDLLRVLTNLDSL